MAHIPTPSQSLLPKPAYEATDASGQPVPAARIAQQIIEKDPEGRASLLKAHRRGAALAAWLRQVKAAAKPGERLVLAWDRLWNERRANNPHTRLVFLGPTPEGGTAIDETLMRYLLLNGVEPADWVAAARCLAQSEKFGVILSMPSKDRALSMVVNMGMADVRRPNDLHNDGTYELLDCVVYPPRVEIERYLNKRPGSAKLLMGVVVELAYGENDAFAAMTPQQRQEEIPKALGQDIIDTHGGPDELLAYQAKGIGPIIARRMGDLEYKRLSHEIREHMGKVGQALAIARAGKQLILWAPFSSDELEQRFPLLTYLLGNLAMKGATDEIEVEEGK